MKKNGFKKLLAIAAAAICVVAASGTTYAWFMAQKESAKVDVSTGKISICVTNLTGDINKLPGESVWVNTKNGAVLNNGSRNGIIEVSFDNNITAKLAKAPDSAFINDYINDGTVWKFTPERLSKVASLEMKEGTFESKGWVKIGNKYYGKAETDDVIDLGKIYLNIGKELGGLYRDPSNPTVQSPSRQFEQGTVFSIGYTAKGIQCTKAAVADFYGQTVADSIPSTWYEN